MEEIGETWERSIIPSIPSIPPSQAPFTLAARLLKYQVRIHRGVKSSFMLLFFPFRTVFPKHLYLPYLPQTSVSAHLQSFLRVFSPLSPPSHGLAPHFGTAPACELGLKTPEYKPFDEEEKGPLS